MNFTFFIRKICHTVKPLGKESIHISARVRLAAKKLESAESIYRLPITHRFAIECSSRRRNKKRTCSSIPKPKRARPAVKSITHLLPRQRLSTVHSFED